MGELEKNLIQYFWLTIVLAMIFLWLLYRVEKPRWPALPFISSYLTGCILLLVVQTDVILILPLTILCAIVMWVQVVWTKKIAQWRWLMVVSVIMLVAYLKLVNVITSFYYT